MGLIYCTVTEASGGAAIINGVSGGAVISGGATGSSVISDGRESISKPRLSTGSSPVRSGEK